VAHGTQCFLCSTNLIIMQNVLCSEYFLNHEKIINYYSVYSTAAFSTITAVQVPV